MLTEQTEKLRAVLIVEDDRLIGLSDLPFPIEMYVSVGIIYASGSPLIPKLYNSPSWPYYLIHQAKYIALHQIVYYQLYLAEHPALYYGVMEGTARMIANRLMQSDKALRCFHVTPSYLKKRYYEQQPHSA